MSDFREMARDPKYRRRFILVGIMLTSAILIAALGIKPLEIEYHKYALEQLHERMNAESTVTPGGIISRGSSNDLESQDWHCHRLAALGYFFHKRYDLKNLPDTDEVHDAFWRLTQSEFPDRRYLALSYPDNVLQVWDLAEHESQWEAFIARNNVADFAERFRSPAAADASGPASPPGAATGERR